MDFEEGMERQEWLGSKLICDPREQQCVVMKRLDGHGIIAESGWRAIGFAPYERSGADPSALRPR